MILLKGLGRQFIVFGCPYTLKAGPGRGDRGYVRDLVLYRHHPYIAVIIFAAFAHRRINDKIYLAVLYRVGYIGPALMKLVYPYVLYAVLLKKT